MITVKKLQKKDCPKCERLSDTIKEIEETVSFMVEVKFETIDILENPEAVEKYGILTLPVMIFERDGVEKLRLEGDKPMHEIMSAISFTKAAR